MTDTYIDMLGLLPALLGALLVVFAFALLATTWFAPGRLRSRLFQPRMIGRFPRTRRNLTIVSCYWGSWGAYITLSSLQLQRQLALPFLGIALILLVPFIRVMRVRDVMQRIS